MYTIDEIIRDVETWLVAGKLNINMLSENFEFNSPFWKKANKNDFIKQFKDPAEYQKTALSKITHFDPLIKYKDETGKCFSIVLQYHTKNGSHVHAMSFLPYAYEQQKLSLQCWARLELRRSMDEIKIATSTT